MSKGRYDETLAGEDDHLGLVPRTTIVRPKQRNPIRGAAVVEKLEFINKQNSVMIKFGLFIY